MAELEFRDGNREVPEHVELILKGIETYRMTYDEAIAAANRRLASDHVEQAFGKIKADHFRAQVRR